MKKKEKKEKKSSIVRCRFIIHCLDPPQDRNVSVIRHQDSNSLLSMTQKRGRGRYVVIYVAILFVVIRVEPRVLNSE